MNKYLVNKNVNIRDAAKQLDNTGIGFVCICDDNNNVEAILTDGDFRRAIIKGINLDNNIHKISNKNFIYVNEDASDTEIINIFLKNKINKIPVIKNGKLIKIILREDYNLQNKYIVTSSKIKIDVVIMAGGKGTRMKPFTNILPKPLIPIGEKTILEVIMDNYNLFFETNFHISVNYKANLIKAYLEEYKELYNFSFLDEDKPLGTGGALKFMENKAENPFFVSNCDILIKADYNNIYKTHLDNNYDITVVASMIHYQVPYGVCEINKRGELTQLIEKPEFDYLVNAGMYIINPETLKYIPENTFYNITDLITKVKNNGGKVGVYPISEKSYLDGGQWKEYADMLNYLE